MPTPNTNLFALLIGIDNYANGSNVPALRGCIADTLAMSELLHQNAPGNFEYHPLLLHDAAANYDGIAAACESHLGQACENDIVLLMFSGHGSRQASAPAFLEERGEDETLVCYDSRLPGHYDLADKEVAVMLSGIRARHLLVILDCCHGGSGTRNAPEPPNRRLRRISIAAESRSLESYAGGYYAHQLASEGRVTVPLRPHLLLAACGPHQLAAESYTGRGAFSQSLELVLSKGGLFQSYASLFEKTRALMLEKGYCQTPQFECHGGEDWEVSFLGLQERPCSEYALRLYEGIPGRWFVDFGAAHGLPDGAKEKLQVEIWEATGVVGTYPLYGLGPERSEVLVPPDFGKLHREPLYARLRFFTLHQTHLDLGNSEVQLSELQEMLPAWVNIVVAEDSAIAAFKLERDGLGRLCLFDHSHRLLRYASQSSYLHHNLLMGTLLKVLRWNHVLQLSNGTMEWAFDAVSAQFDLLGRDGVAKELPKNWRLADLTHADDGLPAYFPTVRISNHSGMHIHAYLLHLGREFGIELLEAREFDDGAASAILWGGNRERGLLLPVRMDQVVDHFLLILSTEPIEAWKLTQRGFELGSEVRGSRDLVARCNGGGMKWVCRRWDVRIGRG